MGVAERKDPLDGCAGFDWDEANAQKNWEHIRSPSKGVADRADCMIFLRAEPWLHPIRSDPRYAGLVRSVGFPAP